MTAVIIGNGAAGISAIEAIRSVDKNTDVKLISKDKVTYSLCALPYYISGEINSKNIHRVIKSFYKKNNIETFFGKKVIKIVPEKNIVEVEDRTKILYKKLLIATGSLPIVPNIKGIDKRGVVFIDNLENSEKLKKTAGIIKRAVVIGAGSIGIECAIALKKLGVEVFVIELLDRVLPKMLDKDLAQSVKKILEENGIKIILGEQALEIVGSERVEGVILKTNNKRLDCELVVIAVGVQPNIELAKSTGIKTNIGIIVDKRMRTNINNIYAAGDVAECTDVLIGKSRINATWPNAIEQGKIAGYNIAGLNKIYECSKFVNVVNIFDTPVVAIGLISSEVPPCEQIKVQRGKTVKKIILKNNKIVGYQAISTLRNAGLIMSLIYKSADVSKLKNCILGDNFAYPLLQQ